MPSVIGYYLRGPESVDLSWNTVIVFKDYWYVLHGDLCSGERYQTSEQQLNGWIRDKLLTNVTDFFIDIGL